MSLIDYKDGAIRPSGVVAPIAHSGTATSTAHSGAAWYGDGGEALKKP